MENGLHQSKAGARGEGKGYCHLQGRHAEVEPKAITMEIRPCHIIRIRF